MKSRTLLIALATAGAAIVVGVPLTAKNLSLDSLPPAVRATIEKEAAGATIQELELEKEDGVEVYDIEILRDGKEIDFMVSTTGKFLGYEHDDEGEDHHDNDDGDDEDHDDDDGHEENEGTSLPLEAVPAPVRDAATALAGANAVTSISLDDEDDDHAVYEVNYVMDGADYEAEITEAGDLLELGHEIEPSMLPMPTLLKLQKKFPNAEIKSAEAITVFFYEIEVTEGGKTKELRLTATGEWMGKGD